MEVKLKLSSRELQLLKLIIKGKSQEDISTEFGISMKAVEAHNTSLRRKLNYKTKYGLIQKLIHIGMSEYYFDCYKEVISNGYLTVTLESKEITMLQYLLYDIEWGVIQKLTQTSLDRSELISRVSGKLRVKNDFAMFALLIRSGTLRVPVQLPFYILDHQSQVLDSRL